MSYVPTSSTTSITSSRSSLKRAQNESVCRDFLRNVCKRGKKCKFSHDAKEERMTEEGQDKEGGLQVDFVFCHDFINLGNCYRLKCKFIHATREEQDEFRATGYVPPHIRDQAIKKAPDLPDLPTKLGKRPICKDHLKGACLTHRNKCKFRHVSARDYDLEINGLLNDGERHSPNVPQPVECNQVLLYQMPSHELYSDVNVEEYQFRAPQEPLPPQSYPQWQQQQDQQRQHYENGARKKLRLRQDTNHVCHGSNSSTGVISMIEQENMLLKQRLEELKKQVHDLNTTNEFLLEQNAHLRLGVKSTTTVVNGVAPATQITVPAQAGPPVPPGTTIVSMAPVVQPIQPSMSMSQPIQPTMSLTQPVVSGSAIAHSLPPTAGITISALEAATGPPQPMPTVVSSLPVQPISAAIACQEIVPPSGPAQGPAGPPQGPPPGTGNVHVQETRLVTYPITSIRQAM